MVMHSSAGIKSWVMGVKSRYNQEIFQRNNYKFTLLNLESAYGDGSSMGSNAQVLGGLALTSGFLTALFSSTCDNCFIDGNSTDDR